MATITLNLRDELQSFLPPSRRGDSQRLSCHLPAPARHLIETCGVPHTEVGLILCDGCPIDLETPVADGQHLEVYPRPPLASGVALRFLADAHLGALARRLRLLGFDTLYCNDLGDAALVRLAVAEGRILLTRDRALLMRQALRQACYLRPTDPDEQMAQLIRRFQLCAAIAPFSRCLICNTPVKQLAPAEAAAWVPEGIHSRVSDYWRCSDCGRIYWPGSHWQAMRRRIEAWCGDQGLRDP